MGQTLPLDRVSDVRLLDERLIAESGKLLAEWLSLPKHRSLGRSKRSAAQQRYDPRRVSAASFW
jgi:hypothetical protein